MALGPGRNHFPTVAEFAGVDVSLATAESAGGERTLGEWADLIESVVLPDVYQGTWNASTNTPAIPAAGAGNIGWFYIVAVAGTTTIDGISSWAVNDKITSNGTVWQKIPFIAGTFATNGEIDAGVATDKPVHVAGVVRAVARHHLGLPFIDTVGSPVGDDWTAVFETAAATGLEYQLRPNTTYEIHSPIECAVNGFGLYGYRSSVVYLPAEFWTNVQLPSTLAEAAASCAFYCHGSLSDANAPLAGLRLQGFTIESEVQESRCVHGIVLANTLGTRIFDVEIHGFPVGKGIICATVIDIEIAFCHIHNFLQDAAWDWWTPGAGASYLNKRQSSGIEVDNYRIDDTYSTRIKIHHNTINDIRFTGAALSILEQTDGINLQGLAPIIASVTHNDIFNIGEGVDCFSEGPRITENDIHECSLLGIKMLYNCRRSMVAFNRITNIGVKGIHVYAGDDTVNIYDNQIVFNIIRGIDPGGLNDAAATAGIWIESQLPGDGIAYNNTVAYNYVDPTYNGGEGDYAIVDTNVTPGHINIIENNTVVAGLLGKYHASSNMSFGRSLQTLAVGSAVTLTTNTSLSIFSKELPPGAWDVSFVVHFTVEATTSVTQLIAATGILADTISLATINFNQRNMPATVGAQAGFITLVVPVHRYVFTTTTTIYATVRGLFSVASLKAHGYLLIERGRTGTTGA